MGDGIGVKWVAGRRIHIKATRGAVTTEATLTEAEAGQLLRKLDKVLRGTRGPDAGPAP
jgi:hypothetical protein